MKKITYSLILVFCCSVTLAQAGGDPVKKFYRKYKKKDQVRNIYLPGILTRTGVGIARAFVKNNEAKAGLKLAKKMKGLRVLVDNGHQISKAERKSLIRDLMRQGKMETIVRVRDGDSYTVIMGQIKNKKIKEIVIINIGEDEFTMVAAKSRLKVKHINRLLRSLQKKKRKERKRKEPIA